MKRAQRTTIASDPAKTSRWPRTTQREERIRGVLARRQPDLTVVLENVHDPHNVSAVLRSCDAVGVLRVHTVYTVEGRPAAFGRTTSASASKWIDVVHHASIESCYAALRDEGTQILTTALRDDSISLYEPDLSQPVALVFGNEQRGATDEAVELADGTIYIPMMGMVESLNISVACAVTLYEVLRQRTAAGMYNAPRLTEPELTDLTQEWLHR
jgi:tRNA (guanosine-2'-O-)-methyltransferase